MTLNDLFTLDPNSRVECGKNSQVGHCGTATSSEPNCVGAAYPTHC